MDTATSLGCWFPGSEAKKGKEHLLTAVLWTSGLPSKVKDYINPPLSAPRRVQGILVGEAFKGSRAKKNRHLR